MARSEPSRGRSHVMNTDDTLSSIVAAEDVRVLRALAEHFSRSILPSEVLRQADELKLQFELKYLHSASSRNMLLRFALFLEEVGHNSALPTPARQKLAGLGQLVAGDVMRQHGDFAAAIASYRAAINYFREARYPIGEARAKIAWF